MFSVWWKVITAYNRLLKPLSWYRNFSLGIVSLCIDVHRENGKRWMVLICWLGLLVILLDWLHEAPKVYVFIFFPTLWLSVSISGRVLPYLVCQKPDIKPLCWWIKGYKSCVWNKLQSIFNLRDPKSPICSGVAYLAGK